MFPWLSRRGMNIGQFSKLVEGRVPPHTPDQLDHKVNIRTYLGLDVNIVMTGLLPGPGSWRGCESGWAGGRV